MKVDITIRNVEISHKAAWDTLVDHPLQTWIWGEFRKAMGIDVERLGVFNGDTLIEAWQLTFHQIPYTPFTIGYFPKGPLPTEQMIMALKKLGKQKRALYIQLEPNVIDTDTSTKLDPTLGLHPSHRPMFTKHTFTIDCTKSEEELLKSFHQKTRYNINLAKKRGVTIAEDNSDTAFDAYERLSDETTARQGFYAHNHTYHRTLWKMLHTVGVARIFTATYENTILAAWMLFVWNKHVYYPYGASSREHREVMAPTLLLWEIVRWAKKEGYSTFDLWGALGPNPDPQDPWYGFHKFKQGYNPTLISFIGSYDLVVHPLGYSLFRVVDSIRWAVLKLKHRT